MLFLEFVLYLSSFVGTKKNELPVAALELCQLKFKQFWNSAQSMKMIFLLEAIVCFLALFCLYFMQVRVDWVLIVFGTQVIKKIFSSFHLFISYDYGYIKIKWFSTTRSCTMQLIVFIYLMKNWRLFKNFLKVTT